MVSLKEVIRTVQREAPFVLLCLLVVLLGVGLAYSIILGNSIRYWDEEHYLLLAKNLRTGIYSFDGKTPTAFQPPGYPFVLFFLSYASSSLTFLRFCNYIFLSLAIALLFWMLNKEEGSLAAAFGAILASFYPLFFYSAGTFYPQILCSTLFLSLFALILTMGQGGWWKELIIGLLLGALMLVSPSFLLYLPIWTAYPWFTQLQKKCRASVLLVVGCALIVGCWTLRNERTFERFVLISTNSGVNLLLGNSENTTPQSGVNVDIDKYVNVGKNMNEFDQDIYYENEAIQWIKEHPKKAFKLYVAKVLNFFYFTNDFASKAEASPTRDILLFISYYPILLLAILRLCVAYTQPLSRFEWYLFLFLVLSPFLQAIFFTRVRFRIPFDFLTIYFAAGFLQLMCSQSSPKELKRA